MCDWMSVNATAAMSNIWFLIVNWAQIWKQWSNTRPGTTVHTDMHRKWLSAASEEPESKQLAVNMLHLLSVFFFFNGRSRTVCTVDFIFSIYMSFIHTVGLLHVNQWGRLSARKAAPAEVTAASLIVEYPVKFLFTMDPVCTLPGWDGKQARRGTELKRL